MWCVSFPLPRRSWPASVAVARCGGLCRPGALRRLAVHAARTGVTVAAAASWRSPRLRHNVPTTLTQPKSLSNLMLSLSLLLLLRKGVHEMGVYIHRASRCNASPWDQFKSASACALTPTSRTLPAPCNTRKEILNSSTRGINWAHFSILHKNGDPNLRIRVHSNEEHV